MSLLSQSEKLCAELNQTYDSRIINSYPHQLQNIIFEIASKNKKPWRRNERTKINHTLISLIDNLQYPKKQPVTKYITGPGNISKWVGQQKGQNKVIYLFGENSHFDRPNCAEQINTRGNGEDFHMNVIDYLLKLFKTSPVFIDFYVEFGVMLDDIEFTRLGTGQTLHDMLYYMQGCFGPLLERDCPYNVRMHGVDARAVIGKKSMYYKHKIYELVMDMKMYLYIKDQGGGTKKGVSIKEWTTPNKFKRKYRALIKQLAKIRTNTDIVDTVIKIVDTNPLFQKEIRKSALEKKQVVDFFVKNGMKKSLRKIKYGAKFLGIWFNALGKSEDFPKGMDVVSLVLTITIASLMDVYAVTRMFKTFDVDHDANEHYPPEANHIIYYAGDGHTNPMGKFLEHIGFKRTEYAKPTMTSCVNMMKITQPLFS